MTYTYQEGFINAGGLPWTCTNNPATKVGNKWVYSGALTPDKINSPDFSITFSATAGNDGATVDVSRIRARVIYTLPLTSSTQTGRGGAGFSSVAYGAAGLIVACGSNGVIWRSTDKGATWASISSGTAAHLRSITWNGSSFVIVGDAGVVLTSADGSAWAKQISGVTSSILGVNSTPSGQMVMVGAQDIDKTSIFGVTWR